MLELHQPENLRELGALLKGCPQPIFAAGGTDLMIRLNRQRPITGAVVDLSRIDTLKGFQLSESGLWIGAMCTMTELCSSPKLAELAGVLHAAAGTVGSTQIRNRATLGGNVANAAQCADTIPALLALDARLELLDQHGEKRMLSVSDFVVGIGETRIQEREIITGFLIPEAQLGLPGGYGKIGSRETVTIAKINGAAVADVVDGRVTAARVAFGSLGRRAFLSESVAAGLQGRTLEELGEDHCLELFVQQVEAAIPGRDSLPYKRSAVKAVARELLDQLISKGRGC